MALLSCEAWYKYTTSSKHQSIGTRQDPQIPSHTVTPLPNPFHPNHHLTHSAMHITLFSSTTSNQFSHATYSHTTVLPLITVAIAAALPIEETPPPPTYFITCTNQAQFNDCYFDGWSCDPTAPILQDGPDDWWDCEQCSCKQVLR